MKRETLFFIFIPLAFNLLFLSFYFSGVEDLQRLIAPKIPGLHEPSWREFGLVELAQNFFLLGTVVLLLVQAVTRKLPFEKAFFLLGTVVMLFLLLEEIDYGVHFYHLYLGEAPQFIRFNWHNQHTFSDHENARYLRRISDTATIICFIILPLLVAAGKLKKFRPIIPSPWFITTLIISFLCSSLGHNLEDMGLDVINGNPGLLAGNISEFRETTSYYICLLYGWQLAKASTLISGHLQLEKSITH